MGSKHAALIGCTWSDDGQTWLSVTPQKATCLAEPRAVPLHDVIIFALLVLARRQLSFPQLFYAGVLASGCP